MATAISKNQYDYLNNLVSGGGGKGEWAKSQLANSTYTPPAPTTTTPSVPTNMNVPPTPAQASSAGKVPTSNVPSPPTAPTTTTVTAPKTNPQAQQYADFQKQQSDLMSQLQSYMQPMKYDPNTDPAYLARKQWSARQTDLRQQEALEGLTERGFSNVNNSMALQQSGQIAQDAQLADNAYSAQLEQQYYQRQRDRVADVFNLLQNSQNQQQRSFDNMNTDRNFGLNQGQATGYYTPDAGTMDSVRAKMAENSARYANASPEEQRRLHEENVKLAASIGGVDTTGNGDYAFGPLRTVQGQQLDLNQRNNERDFEYQTVQDAIRNGMSQQQIDNQAEQFAKRLGFDYANMNSNDKQAWAQIAISQQNADTNSANSSWNMSINNPDNQYKMVEIDKARKELEQIGKTKPITTQDAIKVLNDSRFVSAESTTDQFGNTTKTGKTSVDKPGMVQAIVGLGLPDEQMDALFNYYGISQKEIQDIEKQLRGN